MATLNELYNAYLRQGVTYSPGSTIGGLSSLTNNININRNDGENETNTTSVTGVPSTFQPTKMDMLGLLFNPVMGLANIASRTSTGLSIADRVMDAMGIGRGPGGRTEGYGVDSMAGMASGPTHGVDDVNSQSVGADASAGGDAGAAAASAAGANDGPDTGGSFAQGGRVNFSNGGSYWQTVQETYDAAGGEEGTGMGLIDFANKYFPKMADGGRAGYLQGGLVSLLR